MRSNFNGRRLVAVAAVIVLSVVAAACGSDSKKASGGGAPAAASDVDPNGVLRIGTGLTGLPGGVTFDPTLQQATTIGVGWTQAVLGTLLRATPKGDLVGMMAKSYKIVDGQTVQLTIRDGMKFTDGTAYDAQAVKEGLIRTRDQVSPQAKSSQSLSVRAMGDITVDSPLQLTVKFTSPVAGQFVGTLATWIGAIVSPAQAKSAPSDISLKAVGAGPYTVVSASQTSIKLKKNPDYWDAKSWRVGGIEWIDVPEQSAQMNGMRAGTIDMAFNTSPTNAQTMTADPAFAASSAFVDNSYFYMDMCMGKPPFDNEKVRQAIDIGIDRDELNKVVFGGLGAPAYGLWPKGHVYNDPKLATILKYDPVKAKQLLADAGPITFEIWYQNAPIPDLGRIVEGVQGQLAKLNITAKVMPGDVLNQFVVPKKAGAVLNPASRNGVDKYTSVFGAGQRLSLCDVTHQEILDKLQPAIAAAPGDPSMATLFKEADETMAEHAYLIPLVFSPRINTYAKTRVGGTLTGSGIDGTPLFDSIYIKKK